MSEDEKRDLEPQAAEAQPADAAPAAGEKVSEVYEGNMSFDLMLRYDDQYRQSIEGAALYPGMG